MAKKYVKITSGFRGEALQSASAGNGTPCADPSLPILYSGEVNGVDVDIVSGTSVAVGVNEKGYLVPASEKIKAIGVMDYPLFGTAKFGHMADSYSGIGDPNQGFINSAGTLAEITPTVYNGGVLFQYGNAYKKDGATKEIFEIKHGDCLRVIKTDEIEASVADGTLPILFQGETAANAPKTKAMYAGRLVKWDGEKDKADELIARVLGMRSPAQYDSYNYTGDFAYGFDIQGPATAGLPRDLWNTLGTALQNQKDYETSIIDFKVTM